MSETNENEIEFPALTVDVLVNKFKGDKGKAMRCFGEIRDKFFGGGDCLDVQGASKKTQNQIAKILAGYEDTTSEAEKENLPDETTVAEKPEKGARKGRGRPRKTGPKASKRKAK